MKIGIATMGRFHVLDLARELDRIGHEIVFYSLLSGKRLEQFGLKKEKGHSFFKAVMPWMALRQFSGVGYLKEWASRMVIRKADRLVGKTMVPCQVFIGMSGLFLKAGQDAQKRFGARFVLERGSRHIQSQKEILNALNAPGACSSVSSFQLEREINGYKNADAVVVPSLHAEKSFLEKGFPSERLFRIPYGVDTEIFKPTMAPQGKRVVLFVGEWSRRKGVDLLVKAIRQMQDVQLVHVGTVGDVPFPKEPAFYHEKPVEQYSLPAIYARASVFVLPSREDGFGMVLLQALACGLPVVASNNSGGPDLRDAIPDSGMVHVVPSGDVDALAIGIACALKKAESQQGLRDGLGPQRDVFSWGGYGRRYDAFLKKLCFLGGIPNG